MKIKFLTIMLSLFVLSFGLTSAQEGFTLDNTVGLYSPDSITADGATQIVFNIRITNDATANGGVTNGFRIYSDDGAEWTSTTGDTIFPGWMAMFPLISTIIPNNVDGFGADTVGFGGSRVLSGGLPADFNEIVYTLTIGPIETIHHGKTICLDSTFYPNTGFWKWAAPDAFPSWDGPHCFAVVNPIALGVNSVNDGDLPTSFSLSQNYPNPFNPSTMIQFDLPNKSDVRLSIFNVLGQKVKTLINESKPAGKWEVDWNGTSDAGVKVSSGIYFYRLEANDYISTKKMMMLK